MTQVHTVQNLAETFQNGVMYASLNDMIMSVAGEDKPVTLRQIANRGFYDIDTVTSALKERTQSGALATFKIGPLQYFASPHTALTAKGPNFTCFAGEVVRNALWEG